MGIRIKTPEEIKIMVEGGAKLRRVKEGLKAAVKVGVNALEIENLAQELIKKEDAEVSFDKVPGYSWATCVTVNEEVVHGIPHKSKVFKKGDVVGVDVGVYFKGFHTDTSFSVGLDVTPEVKKFLNIGQNALERAISVIAPGKYIYDISQAIESTIEGGGYTPVRALVGHGVGRELHEDPQIPGFVPGRITDSPKIREGMALAVEIIYAMGKPDIGVLSDGWTIAMRDGKISALFEETVIVTPHGHQVIT